MNVRERIIAIKLIGEKDRQLDFIRDLGVDVEMKQVSNIKNNEEKAKLISDSIEMPDSSEKGKIGCLFC